MFIQRFQLISLFSIALFFISCGADINETITIDENLAGSYEVKSDMIPMMRTMAYQFAELAKAADGDENEGGKIDSAAIEEKLFKDFPEEVDSLIPLLKMTKEATLSPEDKAKLEKQLKIFMKGGRKAGVMMMGMNYTFSSIPDLNEFGRIMERNKENDEESKIKNISGNVNYTLNGNTLSRTYTDKKPLNKEDEVQEERMAELIYAQKIFRTTLLSKRKIKTARGEGLVSQEAKKVVFEYPMKDFMEGKANQNFVIEFE